MPKTSIFLIFLFFICLSACGGPRYRSVGMQPDGSYTRCASKDRAASLRYYAEKDLLHKYCTIKNKRANQRATAYGRVLDMQTTFRRLHYPPNSPNVCQSFSFSAILCKDGTRITPQDIKQSKNK